MAPDRTLYVGNLPYDCSQEEVEALISGTGAGAVARVNLPMDPDGRKRGFGFVTMETADAARAAMEALRGADLRGRRLVINIAHPKGERPTRSDAPAGGPPRRDMSQPQSRPAGDRPFRMAPFPAPPPDQPRRTFDEQRRSPRKPIHEGEGDSAARKRRGGGGSRDRDRKNDWEDYDDDD